MEESAADPKDANTSNTSNTTEEDLGKKMEDIAEEIGKKVEEEVEKSADKFFGGLGCSYFAEGFFGAFFTVLWTILIVAFWDNIALFNDDFSKMMDIIYISTVINVGLYLVLMVVRSTWIKLLRDLVSNILSIAFFVILLNVYPFAFSGDWDILENIMRPLIYIVMALIVIATVVDTAKALGKLAKE